MVESITVLSSRFINVFCGIISVFNCYIKKIYWMAFCLINYYTNPVNQK